LGGVAVGYGASAQAGQRLSFIPRAGDGASEFQGLLVTPSGPREATAHPVQRCSVIEGVGLK